MLTISSVEIRFAFYKEREDDPGSYEVDEYETVCLDRRTQKGKDFIDKYFSDDMLLSKLRWDGPFWEVCPREETNDDIDDIDEIDSVWLHFNEDGKPYADVLSYGAGFSSCCVFCDAGHTDSFPIKDDTEDMTIKNLKSIVETTVCELRVFHTRAAIS